VSEASKPAKPPRHGMARHGGDGDGSGAERQEGRGGAELTRARWSGWRGQEPRRDPKKAGGLAGWVWHEKASGRGAYKVIKRLGVTVTHPKISFARIYSARYPPHWRSALLAGRGGVMLRWGYNVV